MKPQSVYLDSNVIIDICDGRRNELKSNIQNAVSTGRLVCPFSAAQISEITSYPLTERCKERLKLLSMISRDTYFVHSTHDYEFRIESPFSVCKTITEALPELNVNKLFSEMIPSNQLKEMRKQFGLDPMKLNNLSGKEAVIQINEAISNSVPENENAPRSISEILDAVKQIMRDQFSSQWKRMGTTEAHMSIGNDLQGVFNLLESFGYWPDSEKVYKKGSRFPDTQHIFNASHCDLLVTRDKGMKNRAEAAYSVLGVSTEVMYTSEYEDYLNS